MALPRRERVPGGYPELNVELLTPQTAYLEYLAERDGINLSEALGTIIVRIRSPQLCQSGASAKRDRRHLRIHPDHLARVDDIAARAGLPRSEILRRLIDEAAATDQTL